MSVDKSKRYKTKNYNEPKKMGLLVENPVYKPFRYPWCYDGLVNSNKEFIGYQRKFHLVMMLEIGKKIFLSQKKTY